MAVDDDRTIPFDSLWKPEDYLNEFYRDMVVADEMAAVRYQQSLFEREARRFSHATMLEFGAGPTVHRALVAAPYVDEIHMADYLKSNLEAVRKWIDDEPGAHDWTHYIRYILELEGRPHPSRQDIDQRAALTRGKISRLFQADAGNPNPLGEHAREAYPIVVSYFCADSATGDKETWRRYMKNIISLVSRGGLFTTAALEHCTSYASGPHRFPSANIGIEDLNEMLNLDFPPEGVYSERYDLPDHHHQGYGGIILAHGLKGL